MGVELEVAGVAHAQSLAFGMRVYNFNELTAEDHQALTHRPKIDTEHATAIVIPIIENVRKKGDSALMELTRTFERVNLSADELVVRPTDLPEPQLDEQVRKAFDVAYDNIRRFHEAQLRRPLNVTTMPGVQCSRICRPIERVGLYVPGGSAVLPSTALMLGIPAQLAGCSKIVLATPPCQDGSICPEVLYAARKCGVHYILRAGGAQAVAAMAYGTQSCPKVDKICGPGNQYVTAAKALVQASVEAMVTIDMPAGPSEQLCIADESSRPEFVVSDLLSQAEHGVDSQVVCVARRGFDENLFEHELREQVKKLPRQDIVIKALSKSLFIRVESVLQALTFTNAYAPEHLVIAVDEPETYVDGIINAGSIFLGHYTPEAVGDYASGTNHSLPTYGYAKMFGGVSIDTFVKYITVQKLSEEGLREIGEHVEKMALVEQLQAHCNAVSLRLDRIGRSSDTSTSS